MEDILSRTRIVKLYEERNASNKSPAKASEKLDKGKNLKNSSVDNRHSFMVGGGANI